MAVKDSEELKSDERYPLGDYSFRIERTSVPGSTNDKIEAICTKDGKNARKSIQIPSSTQVLGWYVEANETEASVYVLADYQAGIPPQIEQYYPFNFGSEVVAYDYRGGMSSWSASPGTAIVAFQIRDGESIGRVSASENNPGGSGWYPYTYNDKTVYYYSGNTIGGYYNASPVIYGLAYNNSLKPYFAWAMIYGHEEGTKETLIARFAIDLEDAGGVGPGGGIGGGWTDPGDYDPDWEEGDPTHTLYVEVTGALSGRHNDPIEDPSYSYIPADKDTVKDYGCGGDGGHGGGGGAGASTVVVHKFATNQANSKEVTAIARRHGYGSGGGKGGKGGDGCILVYY